MLFRIGEGEGEMVEAPEHKGHANHEQWMIMHDNDEENYNGPSPDSSTTSLGSTSSSDTIDDASSSSSSGCSSSNSNGPLYELSELMSSLPIKRGLSKYYEGKSQSFTSLSRVTSIEDLTKKETPYRRKMKGSKSCAKGLEAYKPYTLPTHTISKVSKGSLPSMSFPARSGSFLNNNRPPIPVQKKF
ncbi:hypothetical protein K2173_024427 [Erythroxylum novogranatense]|uniref:Oxidative stress 3 n=1 Tax=Erythroxylum novogranatense TaxID=1862640 RepID=A0AAV8SUE3_9ROSI|nr:hypothetical protein K2173_024427 [Erythroxylum novogranatense]